MEQGTLIMFLERQTLFWGKCTQPRTILVKSSPSHKVNRQDQFWQPRDHWRMKPLKVVGNVSRRCSRPFATRGRKHWVSQKEAFPIVDNVVAKGTGGGSCPHFSESLLQFLDIHPSWGDDTNHQRRFLTKCPWIDCRHLCFSALLS